MTSVSFFLEHSIRKQHFYYFSYFRAMRIVVLTVYLCWLIVPSRAQISSLYPDQFSSFFYNKSFINPAYFPENGESEILLQSKLRSGIHSDISTFGASIQKTFGDENRQLHSVRVSLFNEKEGPYISTPRGYVSYGININIKDDLSLAAGVSLGMVNPNYNTPSRAVSTIIIDGAAGAILRYKQTQIGLSCNQLFNNASTDNRAFNLSRFYGLYIDQSFKVSPFLNLKGQVLILYYTDIPTQFNGAISGYYKQLFDFGVGYRNTSGSYLFSTIKINPESQHPLSVGALYNSTFLSTVQVLGASFELFLKYSH